MEMNKYFANGPSVTEEECCHEQRDGISDKSWRRLA
jgi:hypothetical protein